ncbi:hypothetical protein BDW72DRAFT_185555 [Aspergillus terricola var. indicus]
MSHRCLVSKISWEINLRNEIFNVTQTMALHNVNGWPLKDFVPSGIGAFAPLAICLLSLPFCLSPALSIKSSIKLSRNMRALLVTNAGVGWTWIHLVLRRRSRTEVIFSMPHRENRKTWVGEIKRAAPGYFQLEGDERKGTWVP